MLKISKAKIAHVIRQARDHEARSGHWEDMVQSGFQEEADQSLLVGDIESDTGRGELAEYVSALSDTERTTLIALAMIGRGAFQPNEFAKAVASAKTENISRTEDYLLAIPMVADYLEEGLDKLGYSIKPAGAPGLNAGQTSS
jgi:hypothetical protein